MSWICKLLGNHKPDDAVTEYRKRDDSDNPPFYSNYHYEQYSTCVRCGEEISYVRFFNFWGTKDRLDKGNFREWLDENTKI